MERLFKPGQQLIDGCRIGGEEIKISCLPVNLSPDDERRAAGECKIGRLWHGRYDGGDALLKSGQHTSSRPRRSFSQAAQALRTGLGRYSSGHSATSSSTSMT